MPSSVREIVLPPGPPAAAAARAFLAAQTLGLESSTFEQLEVCLSEVVSNAVRHGRPPVRVEVLVSDVSVLVSVTDHGGPLAPGRADLPHHTAPHGRGLHIVERLCASWGVEYRASGRGKTVWFEMPARRAAVDIDVPTHPAAAAG